MEPRKLQCYVRTLVYIAKAKLITPVEIVQDYDDVFEFKPVGQCCYIRSRILAHH